MNPHENLNNLFEQARKTIPLLDKDEVQNIISSPEPAVKPKSTTKTFIIGAAATLVICGAVYFIFPKDESPKKVAEQNIILIDSANKNTNQSTQIIEENTLNISSEKKVDTKKVATIQTKNSEDLKIEKNNTVPIKAEESPIYPNISIGNYPKRVEEEKSSDGYLHLTNEELANLGIITDGNKLYYKNITDLDSMILDNMTTGEKTGYKDMLPTFEIKIPISGGRSTMTSAYSKDSDLTVFKKFWPDVIEMKDKYDFVTLTNKKIPSYYNVEFAKNVKKMLIPILIPLYHPLGISSRYDTLIFYFKPSLSFFNALPVDILSSAESMAKSYNNSFYNNLVNYYIQKNKTKTDSFNLAVKTIPNLSNRQIILTKEELKKLNIEFDGKMLVYKNKFAINHQKIKLEIKNGGITSVSIDKHYRFFKAHRPQIFPYCTSDTLLNTANFFYKIDEDKSIPYLQLRDQFLTMIDSVVPVRIKYNSGYTQLFWFPKNEAFLKKLSKENQEKILNSDEQPPADYFSPKIDMRSVKMIELTTDELKKLGVTVKEKSIVVIDYYGGSSPIITDYSKEGSSTTFNPNTFKFFSPIKTSDSIELKNVISKTEKNIVSTDHFPSPSLITDDMGIHWKSYKLIYEISDEDIKYMTEHHLTPETSAKVKSTFNNAKQQLSDNLKTFVPILAKTFDEQFKIILWYEPTDSFFAALPKNIADEIKSEYTAIKANQPTPSCKYFEVCQSVKGMINEYSVYPNPTNNELNVLIDLVEERKLTISLTDISGKVVKNFVKDLSQSKGKKEYPFQIGEVSEGMYLLLIESDKGERVTQRIIKK